METVEEFQDNLFQSSQPFWLLALVWGLSAFILVILPELQFSLKILVLIPPMVVSIIIVYVNPKEGFSFWVLGITILVTQTGFQADIGPIRTSALEVLIGILVLSLIALRARLGREISLFSYIPGFGAYLGFVGFATIIFVLGFIKGDSLSLAIIQYKGFVIYPLLIIIILYSVRSEKILNWSLSLMVLWYIFLSGRGLIQFFQGQSTYFGGGVYRADAAYAPTNLFGVSVMALALFLIGYNSDESVTKHRGLRFVIVGWLIAGALVSVSRTVLVAFVVGILFLIISTDSKRSGMFLIIVVAYLALVLLPDDVMRRLFQLSDTSTNVRRFYVSSGWQAFQHFWLTGGGWGNGYWVDPWNKQLIPSGGIPWYHNDYLNLGVQVGFFGLVIYLAFWFIFLYNAYIYLQKYPKTKFSPFIRGSMVALICMLVSAIFEQVLWRPDMGGLLGWVSGVLASCIYLSENLET